MVTRSGVTTRDAAAGALRQLRSVGANVMGAVLNDVDLNQKNYGYGSYYYYRREGYYASDEHELVTPAASPPAAQ